MLIILSFLNAQQKCEVLDAVPEKASSDKIVEILALIMQENAKKGSFDTIIPAEEGSFVNYLFQIKSEWASMHAETVMITAILDEHENPKLFEGIFQKAINRMKADPALYKAFYLKAQKTDPLIPMKIQDIHQILLETMANLNKTLSKASTGLSQLVIIGIQAVGKTSIITRLITGKFDSENIRPTLAPQMLRLYYERVDFRVFDMAGQSRLRNSWTTTCPKPNAIVFVIDATSSKELMADSLNEFNRMMTFYFKDPKKTSLVKQVPVLLLVNKFDLNANITETEINDFYKPDSYGLKYKIGFCSALTGAGLEENFTWLSKETKLFLK